MQNAKSIFMIPVLVSLFALNLPLSDAKEEAAKNTGIDPSIIDFAIDPCDDFYQFSCGNWLKTAEIPADLPMWDRSFMSIREKNRKILKTILENYSSGKKTLGKNRYSKKLGDYYAACMNEKSIEKNGLRDLQEELKQIDALSSNNFRSQLAQLLSEMHLKGINVFFNFGDEQDFKDATQVIGGVDQGGLTLPDRDYYLKDDDKTVEIRTKFLNYCQNILEFLGTPKEIAKTHAEVVLKIETFLAKNSMSRADRRNPLNVYHRLERKGLKEKSPRFDWDRYFSESGASQVQAINVSSPDFFAAFNELLDLSDSSLGSERKSDESNKPNPSKSFKVSASDIQVYLRWHVAVSAIPALPTKFVNENFRFISDALSGQKELEARWKRCVKATDYQMGFALGKAFIDQTYGSKGKKITQEMIQNIEKAFEEELKELSWMNDSTKEQALKKLHSIVNKVGYPEVWRSYDSLSVSRQSFLKNLFAGEEFNSKYHINKIGKSVDRNEWEMSPPTVNAYYQPSMNEMVFPAGILQPPFFDQSVTMSANYGGIGMVMGHELTHGFDDQGRQFDAQGNLKDWWSADVSKAFDSRAECVSQEYEAFESLPGVHLNGKLTLGENIADHGGIRLAYRAWRRSLPASTSVSQASTSPDSSRKITPSHQLSEEQKFFLAFAQAWCSKKQEQLVRMLVKTDPHSPGRFRVNGTLSQFSKFGEAFQCKSGSSMVPAKRCEVW